MDLFSGFDYNWSKLVVVKVFEVSWLVVLLVFVFFNMGLNVSSSFNFFGLGSLLHNSVWLSKLNIFKKFFVFIMILFQFMLVENFFGLFPYVFSITSQVLFNIGVSFFMWVGMMIFIFTQNMEGFFIHLTPLGSPLILVPLLKLIELVSIFIRPITLALRLGVNITTGHIFLALIGVSLYSIGNWLSFIFLITMVVLVGYFLVEFGMGLIQSFVFKMLLVQYSDE